ncbi:hypothetical protein X777_12963, partial [Ooceraea biroi]
AGMRAWKYEKKLEEGEGGDLARERWKEMKKRAKEGRILKGMGNGKERIHGGERMENRGGEDIYEKERNVQREQRWKKIRESRYNKWYGWVKGDGIPGYLKKGWEEKRWQRVARFRLGNGMREGDIGRRRGRESVGYVEGVRRRGNMCGRNVQVGVRGVRGRKG